MQNEAVRHPSLDPPAMARRSVWYNPGAMPVHPGPRLLVVALLLAPTAGLADDAALEALGNELRALERKKPAPKQEHDEEREEEEEAERPPQAEGARRGLPVAPIRPAPPTEEAGEVPSRKRRVDEQDDDEGGRDGAARKKRDRSRTSPPKAPTPAPPPDPGGGAGGNHCTSAAIGCCTQLACQLCDWRCKLGAVLLGIGGGLLGAGAGYAVGYLAHPQGTPDEARQARALEYGAFGAIVGFASGAAVGGTAGFVWGLLDGATPPPARPRKERGERRGITRSRR